jgi:alkanesulfonate monooxygenase SsuD/methylene tetrahydromethanopterin reductase-like flavin-dependent oxidoreductase (luciferase family)
MTPCRFGVSVRHAQSRAELVEKARTVEAHCYATLTVPDHLTDLVAPLPALISAAEATRTLRIGTKSNQQRSRHPVLVAREVATVDLPTDGRLELGLGAGSIKSEYDEAGFSFDPGRTRVERLAESGKIIKSLLIGDRSPSLAGTIT